MADLDEGIGNLEAFNTLVAETSTRLTADTGALEGQAKMLDGLQNDAQGAWDDLGDRMDELQERLESERAQAGEAVDAVADLGGELSDDRIPAAQQTFEDTGRTVEEGLAAVSDEIDGAWADLKGGFDTSTSEAESLATDTEGLTGEIESAFSALASGASADAQQVSAAESLAQSGASTFAGEVAAQEAGAEAVATLATILGDSSAELGTAAEALGSDMSEAYAEMTQENEDGAQAMKGEIDDLLLQAAQHVADEAIVPLDALLKANGNDALPAEATTLEMASVVLDTGAAVAESCLQLVPQLATSQAKVDEIDRLLNVL